MSKISAGSWEEAKILFNSGESLRTIAKKTGIDHTTISKTAKEEGWKNTDEFIALRKQALIAQKGIVDTVTIMLNKVKKIVDKNGDNCLYMKSNNNGNIQYGRVTEFISDLAKAMPTINEILELATEHTQVNIQNNFSNETQDKVNINILPVSTIDAVSTIDDIKNVN